MISEDESQITTADNLESLSSEELLEHNSHNNVDGNENSTSVSVIFDDQFDAQSESNDRHLDINSINTVNDNGKNHMLERHPKLKEFFDNEFKDNQDSLNGRVNGDVVNSDIHVDTQGTRTVWTNLKGMFSNRFKMTAGARPKVVFNVEEADSNSKTNTSVTQSGSSKGVVQRQSRNTGYRRSISCDPLASGETVLPSTEPIDIKYSDENFPVKVQYLITLNSQTH